MANIKTMTIDTIAWRPGLHGMRSGYYWTTETFTTFTYDDGSKKYYVDGCEVTKEDGNAEYQRLKQNNADWRKTANCKQFLAKSWNVLDAKKPEDTFKVKIDSEDITYEALIKRYEDSIDQYVQYIDDYTQYKEACARNDEIRKKIAEFQKLIDERK